MEYRKDFPMLNQEGKNFVYLDNSATTLKPSCVIDEVTRYLSTCSVNVHRGDYDLSYQVSQEYEAVRNTVARFINAASPKEIVYTHGTTEALNIIAYGMGGFLKEGDVILTDIAEHASSVLPWFRVAKEKGASIEYIPLDEQGRITVENFQKAMHLGVKYVCIAHVGNVLGYTAPIQEITTIAHNYDALVIVDGAQAIPHRKVDVQALDCDFYTFSAHKMCGPTGVGVLYGKAKYLSQMEPLMLGGGSNARFDACSNVLLKEAPYRFESGTPAIEGVLGMGKAIEYLEKVGMDYIQAKEEKLHNLAIQELSKLDNVILYNPQSDNGIVTFNIKDVFAQDSASFLSTKGVYCRSGNHCAKILVDHLGTPATVRASFYFYNTEEDVMRLVEVCKEANQETCLNIFF
ncbi:MAG: aminotransferase class V-fold PLP-dependent enzyme [Erysipelotrichales bacterium]|nr:aminotransferase class V-fold PLP-dependent enzyme [Erysipelotrichales bacterium]